MKMQVLRAKITTKMVPPVTTRSLLVARSSPVAFLIGGRSAFQKRHRGAPGEELWARDPPWYPLHT